jgi:murein DD-endopeptidase MepM/ murein hydrolase activator NlpD
VGLLGLVVGGLGTLVLPEPLETAAILLAAGGFVLMLVGLVLSLFPGGPRLEPRVVAPPVDGRWMALNSPASKVPSHGTHGYGQTFGIDLVYEPEPGERPAFGAGPAFRPPHDFPAFGQPLYSPVDGTVVAVWDRARDHRSRSSWPALIYMMLLEGFAREVAGVRRVLGNHVVIDAGDGSYAVLAHLRRGSAVVRPGQRVNRGELVGRCGNSGNTSEPHVHFQLQDHRSPLLAAGVPFEFEGAPVPGNEEFMAVPARR